MTSAINVKVGDTLQLRLGLDGQNDNTAVVVKCTLRDAANSQIGSVLTLTHVGEGVFKDASQVMPDTAVVTARYIVYAGDGVTVHADHLSAMDEFLKDETGQTVSDNLDVAVSSREAEADAATRASTNQTEHDATQSAVAALDDLNAGQIQAAMTAQGYTEARAVKLDNLDATVSSRESEASADARADNLQEEHDDTQKLLSTGIDPTFDTIEGGDEDDDNEGESNILVGSTL